MGATYNLPLLIKANLLETLSMKKLDKIQVTLTYANVDIKQH